MKAYHWLMMTSSEVHVLKLYTEEVKLKDCVCPVPSIILVFSKVF